MGIPRAQWSTYARESSTTAPFTGHYTTENSIPSFSDDRCQVSSPAKKPLGPRSKHIGDYDANCHLGHGLLIVATSLDTVIAQQKPANRKPRLRLLLRPPNPSSPTSKSKACVCWYAGANRSRSPSAADIARLYRIGKAALGYQKYNP